MNKIILMGRLTKDPELKQTPQDVAYCNFAIAVDRDYVNKSTNGKDTDFFNITAWRQQAEAICKHFHKGKMILVEGQMFTSKYDKDGETRTMYQVKLDKFDFCGDRKREDTGPEQDDFAQSYAEQDAYQGFSRVSDDEVPF